MGEVVAAITRAVAEGHGLRVHRVALIRAGTIAKTTSGKIRRHACKAALLAGRLQLVDGQADAEQGLAAARRMSLISRITHIVSEVGGIPIGSIQVGTSLHTFGIDSLAGVNIAYEVGLLTRREVPSWLLTEYDTVGKLVDYVIEQGG